MMKIKPYSENNETKAKVVIGSDMPLPQLIVPNDDHVLLFYTTERKGNLDKTHQSKYIKKLMRKPWLKP